MLKRILVVDDSKFIFSEISDVVEREGHEVVGHAKSGEEGILMYSSLKPDIVTLDIIMPGIDGIEAAGKILKIDPNARIIILSSLYDHDTIEEINQAGLKHIVAKPIEANQLLAALDKIQEES